MNRPWANQYAACWTPEHDAARCKHVADGLSGAEVAAAINEEFGTVYTRNAVIGRNHRKGTRSLRLVKNDNHKRTRISKLKRVRISKPKPEPVMPISCEEIRTADVVPLNLPLLELREQMCRYPYGDNDFLFCGNPTLEGMSYCWEHHGITHWQRDRSTA